MSGRKITGIILSILGLIGSYYYIGGYFELKNQFGNVFGVADETLKNYWPMMTLSIAMIIIGICLLFINKDDNQTKKLSEATPNNGISQSSGDDAQSRLKKTRIMTALIAIVAVIGIGYFANHQSSTSFTSTQNNNNNVSQKNSNVSNDSDITPKEFIIICGANFLYLSQHLQDPAQQGFMNNRAYSFINLARYGYDQPYFNKNAEADAQKLAIGLAENGMKIGDVWQVAQACKDFGRGYGIIITGMDNRAPQ